MEDVIVGITSFMIGYIFFAFLFVMIFQMFLAYGMSSTKYEIIMNQVNEYMKHKQLPIEMQERLVTFYEYKFQKRYFREVGIANALSVRLRKEISLFGCRKLVQNVSVMSELPQDVVMEVISHLKSEVFLPNDIIVKAGTPGDCMYFLETGTVSVLTRNGKEVGISDRQVSFIRAKPF